MSKWEHPTNVFLGGMRYATKRTITNTTKRTKTKGLLWMWMFNIHDKFTCASFGIILRNGKR